MKFLILFLAMCNAALAAPTIADNLAAKGLALQGLADSDRIEAAYVSSRLDKFKPLGIDVGPLCIQLAKGCFTRKDLAYRPGVFLSLSKDLEVHALVVRAQPYNSSLQELRFNGMEGYLEFLKVVRENGVDPQALLFSLELKDKLEHEYLKAYARIHPNRPDHIWQLSPEGEVHELAESRDSGD